MSIKEPNRRFTIEEIENGWLLKISELGSEKLVGRYAYFDIPSLIDGIKKHLGTKGV